MIKKEDIIKILEWYNRYDFEIEENMTKEELLDFAESFRDDISDWEGDGWSVEWNEITVSIIEDLKELAERS